MSLCLPAALLLGQTRGLARSSSSCLCCFTSTEAKWLIRDGYKRGTQGDERVKATARKRPERPWTAARTMEMLRRCPLALAQRLVHCTTAVSTAVFGQSHKDNVTSESVALLLTNNSKRKKSNFRSPAPPPCS